MHVSEKVAAFSIVMVFVVVFLQPWKTFICKGGGGGGERESKRVQAACRHCGEGL